MEKAKQTAKSPKSRGAKTALKIAAITLLTGGLGFAGYWFWWRPKQQKQAETFEETSAKDLIKQKYPRNPPPRINTNNYSPDRGFPLREGMAGLKIMLIQEALNDRFSARLKVDGKWGPATTRALRSAGLPNSLSAQTLMGFVAQMKKGFPVQKGSRGGKVIIVQSGLIAKYGPSILLRYGADGDWGNETDTALRSKGLPMRLGLREFGLLAASIIKGEVSGLGSPTGEGVQALTITRTRVMDDEENEFFVPEGIRLGTLMQIDGALTTILTPDGRKLTIPSDSITIL